MERGPINVFCFVHVRGANMSVSRRGTEEVCNLYRFLNSESTLGFWDNVPWWEHLMGLTEEHSTGVFNIIMILKLQLVPSLTF